MSPATSPPAVHDEQLVSVIIPAFNAAKTLPATLRSAAAQSYANIELLIVDDGSTDETAEIARSFCRSEPRARLISQSNAGVAAARNVGMSHATGAWVAPLDADDLWHPTKIARQVETALAAPEPPGFVYCWFHLIDEADQVIGSSEGYEARGRTVDAMLFFNFVGNGSALLIRRDAALEGGGYTDSLRPYGGCEDLELQLRLAHRYPVEVVPEFLVGYRVLEGSMSSNPDKMHRSWQRALQSFQAAGGTLNRRAIRWNRAYRALRRAEDLVRRGEKPRALREVALALWLDPSRTSGKLGYRFAKALMGKVSGRTPRPGTVPFSEASTTTPYHCDANRIAPLASALARWDKRRMAAFLSA